MALSSVESRRQITDVYSRVCVVTDRALLLAKTLRQCNNPDKLQVSRELEKRVNLLELLLDQVTAEVRRCRRVEACVSKLVFSGIGRDLEDLEKLVNSCLSDVDSVDHKDIPSSELTSLTDSDYEEGDLFRGRYRLQKYIPSGVARSVFFAHDVFTETNVVIKFYTSKRWWKQELDGITFAGEKLAPKVIEQYEENLALILQKGSWTLEDRIKRRKMSPPDIKKRIHDIALLIKGLQDKQLCHCDIKPSNLVYFPEDDDLKLIDFDICTTVGSRMKTHCTPKYAPPEVVFQPPDGVKASYSVDVWSMGMILLHMLNGASLFESNEEALSALRQYIYNDQPLDFPSDHLPWSLLPKLLHRNPVERMTIEEFLANSYFKDHRGLTTDLQKLKADVANLGLTMRHSTLQILNSVSNEIPRMFLLLPNFQSEEESQTFWNCLPLKPRKASELNWHLHVLCEGNGVAVGSDCHLTEHPGFKIPLFQNGAGGWFKKYGPSILTAVSLATWGVRFTTAFDIGPFAELLNVSGDLLRKDKMKIIEDKLKFVNDIFDEIDLPNSLHLNDEDQLQQAIADGSLQRAFLENRQQLQELFETAKAMPPYNHLSMMMKPDGQIVWVCKNHQNGLIHTDGLRPRGHSDSKALVSANRNLSTSALLRVPMSPQLVRSQTEPTRRSRSNSCPSYSCSFIEQHPYDPYTIRKRLSQNNTPLSASPFPSPDKQKRKSARTPTELEKDIKTETAIILTPSSTPTPTGPPEDQDDIWLVPAHLMDAAFELFIPFF